LFSHASTASVKKALCIKYNMSKPGYFLISKSNADFFSNTASNDLLIHTHDELQKIVMGTTSNMVSAVTISGSNVGINNSDPTVPLDVTGTIRADTISAGFGEGTAAAPSITFTNDSNTGMFNFAPDFIGFANAGNLSMTISSNGFLGIGLSNPAAALHVEGEIFATGEITGFYSDERLKIKVSDINGALEKVCQMSAFKYSPNEIAQTKFKENPDARHIGVSAQEVKKFFPELVTLAPFDAMTDPVTGNTVSRSGEHYLTVKYDKLTSVLIQAVKELNAKVDTLTEELAALKA